MRHALIATAVPSQGRIMRGGEVYVNGVPLSENPLRFEPLSLPSAPLADLLRTACSEMSVHMWRCGHAPPLSGASGLHAYVADCESDDDLDRLARFAMDHSARLLIVGASGFGTALAKQLSALRMRNIASANRCASKPLAAILFVVGSRTPASAEQIVRLIEEGAQEIAMRFPFAEHDMVDSFGMDARGGVRPSLMVLRPPASLEFVKESSSEIAAALGQSASRVVRHLEIDAVVISGGDTALAVFHALDIGQADLLGELSPGVPLGTVQIDRDLVTFVTKSGSFGDPDALVEIARFLRRS
jgi:D-threonate/D-erythronate kinase